MRPPQTSRRSVLRTGGTIAALIGTGTLAGCLNGLGDSDDGAGGSDRISDVPPTADALVGVDMNTFFADDGVRNTYNAWLETRTELDYYEGPTSLAETLDDFERREGADLRDLSRFTAFFSYSGEKGTTSNDGTGYLFEGGWDESEFVGLFDHEYANYTESTDGEYTVYEAEDEYTATLAVLEDGRYVAGGPDAVQGAIDVDRGETDPIDGPVAEAYRNTTPGPVRFGARVQEWWFPEELDREDSPLDLSPLKNVETAAGSIHREGNTRILRVALAAPDADAGEDLEHVVDGSLAVARGRAEEQSTPAFIADLLADLTVSRDGATVALSVERTVAELEEMASEFGESTTGSSSSGGGSSVETPTIEFDFDYDVDARTATITHTGGDIVRAENIGVDGDGFVDVEDVDMTEPGEWAGTSGDGEIAAGDFVTVGVEPDATLIVYWSDDDRSAALDHWEGPEA